MFESARLKLTAWYLLIIMLVSLFFSIAFYNIATRELHRVILIQKLRQAYYDNLFPAPPPPPQASEDEQEEDSDTRLAITLVLIDVGILVLAGGAAYFLAGRTLRPIKVMVDEQNRFVTDASHELRTPLTALRAEMEASLLEDKITSQDARQLIQSNLEDIVQLQALSDNLLQLAQRKETTAFQLHNLSLSKVAEEAIKKVNASAKKKHIVIDPHVDSVTVRGEQQSLVQLLVILLDNAVKYSHDHTLLTLSISKTEHSARIVVQDQGVGIADKDLLHIFDRFYRADKSRTRSETSGYGLGLSIAKMIVEMHRGTIQAKSELGKGTVFTIHIPIN